MKSNILLSNKKQKILFTIFFSFLLGDSIMQHISSSVFNNGGSCCDGGTDFSFCSSFSFSSDADSFILFTQIEFDNYYVQDMNCSSIPKTIQSNKGYLLVITVILYNIQIGY